MLCSHASSEELKLESYEAVPNVWLVGSEA
jgi:hypothetical protein